MNVKRNSFGLGVRDGGGSAPRGGPQGRRFGDYSREPDPPKAGAEAQADAQAEAGHAKRKKQNGEQIQ